ncbi:MAG: glycosyltransferase family 4 protein [Porphyromonadaceae bacterium]|nr:glycosyltransferase family 4 protein [Porphyromonadaceae bacterium]
MRIAYCIQGLFRTGGIERVVSTKANYWVQHGHEVCIITTDQRGHRPAFDLDSRIRLVDLGLNYEADNQLGRLKRLKALYAKRGEHKHRLEKMLREFGADITVSTFFQDAPILPSIQDGSKKVLELHSAKNTKVLMYPKEQWVYRLLGRFRVWQDERIAKRYNAFVILTEEERGLWTTLNNLHVIPNPRPFDGVIPSALDEKRILALGRFEYQKNFGELINIWSEIAPAYPDWELCITGSGPYESKLKEQIKFLGLEQAVKLRPATREVAQLYQAASIYALSSNYEGLPMVLIEAQTFGLPIVSYACPSGPKDIVTDDLDGYLVNQGDRNVFVEKLTKLMDDQEKRKSMAQAALKSSERYSLPTVMAMWERLFEAIR